MTEKQPATRPPFKVSGIATIKHLNVRKEGPEDEKILAVDVKLDIKSVDRRLCAYFDEALEAFLWRGDTNALISRNAFLVPVTYMNEISSASVSIGEHQFLGCDVKKFQMAPMDGGVMTLTCSVALYPNSGDVAELAKFVQDEVNVSIEGPPDLFAGEPDAAPTPVTADLLQEGEDAYKQAVVFVKAEQKASISLVQRKMKISYNAAARLIELMELRGIVSKVSANGHRTLIATAKEWPFPGTKP
jgi:hypothetical protein